jgi:hypothetical protein
MPVSASRYWRISSAIRRRKHRIAFGLQRRFHPDADDDGISRLAPGEPPLDQ